MNRVKLAILVYLSIITYIILFRPKWILNDGRKRIKTFGFTDSDTFMPISVFGPLLGIIIYLIILYLDINLDLF